MDSPQFKAGNVGILNEKIALSELRRIEPISVIGLYISETLLFFGIVLILLNNLNVISPGSYFGAYNWVTIVVFSIGLYINFISIPFLYFSSLRNFIKENEFWDNETFWILPLFFFGTFFLYNSLISSAFISLIVSIVIIAIIHVRFIMKAQHINDMQAKGMLVGRGQYVMTLKYLSAYYILLLVALIIFDPLRHAFVWIRLHI